MDFISLNLLSNGKFMSSMKTLVAIDRSKTENQGFINDAYMEVNRALQNYSISRDYYAINMFNSAGDFFSSRFDFNNEALLVDGGNAWHKFRYITLPLTRGAMNSVIILSFIGGLRSFDLIMVMTKGGPGFSTSLISYVIYVLYANSLYGLSTAGNVILFIVIGVLAFPLYKYLTRTKVEL